MIDIDLMAADFDAELNKVKALNDAKRLERFLQELTALSDKYEIYIEGCGCCGSPWLNDIKAGKNYDNLAYGQDRYEVDG
jgi:hypothetical protein